MHFWYYHPRKYQDLRTSRIIPNNIIIKGNKGSIRAKGTISNPANPAARLNGIITTTAIIVDKPTANNFIGKVKAKIPTWRRTEKIFSKTSAKAIMNKTPTISIINLLSNFILYYESQL